jgi:hypothetical protein
LRDEIWVTLAKRLIFPFDSFVNTARTLVDIEYYQPRIDSFHECRYRHPAPSIAFRYFKASPAFSVLAFFCVVQPIFRKVFRVVKVEPTECAHAA